MLFSFSSATRRKNSVRDDVISRCAVELRRRDGRDICYTQLSCGALATRECSGAGGGDAWADVPQTIVNVATATTNASTSRSGDAAARGRWSVHSVGRSAGSQSCDSFLVWLCDKAIIGYNAFA